MDITASTTKPINKRTGSLHMVRALRQPVAKMLKRLTWTTLFLTKHRIKSHISKVKLLPPSLPLFSMLFLENFRMISYCDQLWEGRGRGLTKCVVYTVKFASYLGRVLCKTSLSPRINSLNCKVVSTFSYLLNFSWAKKNISNPVLLSSSQSVWNVNAT